MNSFSILLLLGIGTLVAFLLLVAEVRYFMRYKEFQTVREKMNHADSWKEFVFWHREYLALLWSLLPGISAARVKEIRQSRSRRRSNGREKKSDGFASMLAPSLLGICVCVVCLIGGTYAWFTATKTVSVQSIQMASYNVVTTVKASDGTASSASSSVKEDGCFRSSDLDRLKYFLRYSLNFRCSALRTFSKAHIACLTTWYRSITIAASGKQVRAASKNARLMSITTYCGRSCVY